MGLNLPSALLIGYSSRGDFFGEDIARWRTVQTVTVQGVMDPADIEGDAADIVDTASHEPTNAHLGHSVSINGDSVNNSRLISLEFPASSGSITEQHIGMAKYIATYEVYIVPSSNSDTFFGITFNDLKSLQEFSEDISFELSEDNTYSAAWSMNVKFASGPGGGADGNANESANAIAAAIQLRTNILAVTPESIPTSMQGNGINIWTKTGHWTETEVYDVKNFTCSFSRSRSLLSKNDTDYTAKIKNVLSYGEDGTVTVTEDGEVIGIDDTHTDHDYTSVSPDMDAAKAGAETLISGSYSRCNALYGNYDDMSEMGVAETFTLSAQYKNKSVSYDEQSAKMTYNISYTNDPSFESAGYVFTSKMRKELETSQGGDFVSYTEEGEVTSFCHSTDHSVDCPRDWMYEALKTKLGDTDLNFNIRNTGSANRIAKAFSEAKTAGSNPEALKIKIIPVSKKINYKPNGKTAGFTRKFSEDPSLVAFEGPGGTALNVGLEAGVQKVEKTYTMSGGTTKKEWYNPPNNPEKGEFLHVGPTELAQTSTRKVNYTGTVVRNKRWQAPDGSYTAAVMPSACINDFKKLVPYLKADALKVYTEYFYIMDPMYLDKYYYSDYSWTFNSSYEFSITLEMTYVVPIGSNLGGFPVLHSDNTQITI